MPEVLLTKSDIIRLEMYSQLQSSFDRHEHFLKLRLECEFGFLDELEQSKILEEWHVKEIRHSKGPHKQAAQLLSVLKQQNRDQLYQEVLQALSTAQKHLVNFIRSDGGM